MSESLIALAVPAGLRELFFPPDVWQRLAALGRIALHAPRCPKHAA